MHKFRLFFCENGVLIQEIKTGIPRTGKEKAMFEKATYKEQAYNYLLDLILKNGLEEGKVYSERYFADERSNREILCRIRRRTKR